MLDFQSLAFPFIFYGFCLLLVLNELLVQEGFSLFYPFAIFLIQLTAFVFGTAKRLRGVPLFFFSLMRVFLKRPKPFFQLATGKFSVHRASLDRVFAMLICQTTAGSCLVPQ
jgi:hypothetical protein